MQIRSAAIAVALAGTLVAGGAQAAEATYYESFAGTEIAAISLTNPSTAIRILNTNATNIAVAGNNVYYQDGVNIYRAGLDLSGSTLFHSNGQAPTDIAVDAVNGIYYESFAGIELAAISLSNPSLAIRILNTNATNIALAGGFVYYQDGVNIFRANADLSGATLFHSNGIAPTDLAVYVPPPVTAGAPEPAAWALMLLGFGAVGVSLRRRQLVLG